MPPKVEGKKRPEEALVAKTKEMKSFYDKGCLEIVDPSKLSDDDWKRVIPILKLYSDKQNTETQQSMLKFRMTARGDLIDKNLYGHMKSGAPTLSLLALFIVLKLMVTRRYLRKFADVGTAFLNAERDDDDDIYLKIQMILQTFYQRLMNSSTNSEGKMVQS